MIRPANLSIPLWTGCHPPKADSCLFAWGIQICIFDAAILPVPTATIFSSARFFVSDVDHREPHPVPKWETADFTLLRLLTSLSQLLKMVEDSFVIEELWLKPKASFGEDRRENQTDQHRKGLAKSFV
jgi:hypothetical protein